MKNNEPGTKEFIKVVRHTILVCIVLTVWALTAWWIDKVLLIHLTLEGMSIISFRFFEVALHVSTLRLIYRLLFKRTVQTRWWV